MVRNNNSQSGKVVWVVLGILGLLGAVFFVSCAGYRTDCVNAEAGIKAQYKQNQNNYDNMWKKFKEMAEVPSMYTSDLKKVYDSTMSGRYGKNGSKAVFQFIKEHNPDLDSQVYVKLQAAIEAGRNSFAAEQKQLLAKKESYEKILNGNRGLVFNAILNYPKIDLDEFDIVTSDETEETFKKKKGDRIKLRDDKPESE